MAPSFRSIGTYTSTATGTLVIPAAPGVVSGDLLFMAVLDTVGADFGRPAGWTETPVGAYCARVFSKVATGPESSVSLTYTAAYVDYERVGVMVAYSGVSASPIRSSITAARVASPLSLGVPASTSANDLCVDVVFWDTADASAATNVGPAFGTSPAGWTDRLKSTSTFTGHRAGIVIADRVGVPSTRSYSGSTVTNTKMSAYSASVSPGASLSRGLPIGFFE